MLLLAGNQRLILIIYEDFIIDFYSKYYGLGLVRFIVFFLIIICFPVLAVKTLDSDMMANVSDSCIACHPAQVKAWQASDHEKSMAMADKHSVLGDFNNRHVEHHGQHALFFTRNERYHVSISYGTQSETLAIKFTFGHYPLQQYLVETESGRLQVLPFAWDARTKEAGGQRWYHNYNDEDIAPKDRLHWRQPLQNWNGMCADCHSDGLVRGYNQNERSFSTHFDNINVGCLSCHGDMSEHVKESQRRDVKTADIVDKNKTPTGQWLKSLGDKTARWQGEKRDNSFMDNCFACHSLRTPITDGIKPNTPFLAQFTPQLLTSPNYYVDGQIKEEVYVYGSYLQSKMYAAGVNCLDCHDKHTMKLKIEGNGLCLQCHEAKAYNIKEHHQHEASSEGAQCVNCHMPENRYMGVDDRRDHSFKIPRPDISLVYGTPNACSKCHQDKTVQWASDKVKKWHGEPKKLNINKRYLMALNAGQSISLTQHLSIIADEKIDIISRATAMQLLSITKEQSHAELLTGENLAPYLAHAEPLLRLSAAYAAIRLAPAEKIKLVSPLLKDQYKSVRIAAARSLVSSNVLADSKTGFDVAFSELIHAYDLNSWRGEGAINQGVLAVEMNNFTEAEKSFKTAIAIEPYFELGYINLADFYRAQNKPLLVASVLSKGIKNNPKSADLHYAMGLYFVRHKKLTKALKHFEKSMVLQPNNATYAYTYILSLDSVDQSEQALSKLKNIIENYQEKEQLKALGLHLAQKLRSEKNYRWFLNL